MPVVHAPMFSDDLLITLIRNKGLLYLLPQIAMVVLEWSQVVVVAIDDLFTQFF